MHGLVLVVLLWLSVQDVRHRQLVPAAYPLLLVAVLLRVLLGATEWNVAAAGMLGTFLVLFLVYLFTGGKGIGGGDVKLMTVLGGYFGFWGAMLTIFFGGIYACIVYGLRMGERAGKRSFALVPYLAAGVVTELLIGKYILSFV